MSQYSSESFEELRLADYAKGVDVVPASTAAATGTKQSRDSTAGTLPAAGTLKKWAGTTLGDVVKLTAAGENGIITKIVKDGKCGLFQIRGIYPDPQYEWSGPGIHIY